MNRLVTAGVVAVLLSACTSSDGPAAAARNGGAPRGDDTRLGPGSCHDASFEPVAGSQIQPIAATPATPATLGFRMTSESASKRRFESVRIDVLPLGKHADAPPPEPQLLTGEAARVRRFEATAAQLASSTVSFRFDGRDDAGRVLPAGSYEVGFVVETRSTDPRCTDPLPAVKYGQLTTVVWAPA